MSSAFSLIPKIDSILPLKRGFKIIVLLMLLSHAGFGFAEPKAYLFSNATQEKLYYTLVNDLRCLVCQNQNLADSNAKLAGDLRDRTWEMVINGASEQEVIKYMTDRYGEFVLYRPPFTYKTILLWIGPFALLATGVYVLVVLIRRRSTPHNFSKSDLENARALLEGQDEPS